MDILKLRRQITLHLLLFIGVFLLSSAGLVFFFSQQSGHILWENLVASAIFATILALFALICSFSKWVFLLWLGGTLTLLGVSLLVGWDSFAIDYFRSGTSTGSCLVSFYCLDQNLPGWLSLLLGTALEILFLVDIIFIFTFGVHILVALNGAFPQTRYFMGTFLLGFFSVGLALAQRVPDVPNYSAFQYLVLGLLGLGTLASLCFAIFYKKLGTRVDKFKRIYGAAVIASVPLLMILIPFDVSTAAEEKEAFIFRIAFGILAVFCFVYVGFFAKVRSSTQARNSGSTVGRSKNKGAGH